MADGDYKLAIEAHSTGRPVRFKREFVREDLTYALRHPRQLALKAEDCSD